MYEVACEAYPDVPGEEEAEVAPFEEWLAMDLQGAGDRPEATFVALAGDEVVAYAKLSLSLARPTVAMHDMPKPSPLALSLASTAFCRGLVTGSRGRPSMKHFTATWPLRRSRQHWMRYTTRGSLSHA